MLIALINDTHFGARGDNRDILAHQIKFYREVFWPYIKEHNIKHVFHLGDIVDRRKFINYITYRAMRKEFFDAAPKDLNFTVLVGNHDIPYRETNEVSAIAETFRNYSNIRVISKPTEIVMSDSTKILLLPWINQENHDEAMQKIENTNAKIAFGHLEIAGFEMYRGLPSYHGMDVAVFNKFDVVGSGHFHKRTERGNIIYLGAPYEMTWNDFNCPRGFNVFDTETKKITFVQNPNKLFHKMYYDDSSGVSAYSTMDVSHLEKTFVKVIVSTKKNPLVFEDWLSRIYEANPLDVSIFEDFSIKTADTSDLEDSIQNAEDTISILKKYVDSTTSQVDKNELSILMDELYHDAISMEQLTV